MEKNEIKKVLYKEKPTAKCTLLCENGTVVYVTESSLGKHQFEIPVDEAISADGKMIFEEEEPAQLLIRWLV